MKFICKNCQKAFESYSRYARINRFCTKRCANTFNAKFGNKCNFYKHGLGKTRFDNIYYHLRNRCINPKDIGWDNYGDRGIRCSWDSFGEFKNDMYESYLEHVKEFGERQTTIDRIDNNGHYCKENCRWATPSEQNNNSSRNFIIEFFGKKQTLAQWANEVKISPTTLRKRIVVSDWSIERALTEKPFIGKNQYI